MILREKLGILACNILHHCNKGRISSVAVGVSGKFDFKFNISDKFGILSCNALWEGSSLFAAAANLRHFGKILKNQKFCILSCNTL